MVGLTIKSFKSLNIGLGQEEAINGLKALEDKIETSKKQALTVSELVSVDDDIINSLQNGDLNALYSDFDQIYSKAMVDYLMVTDKEGNVLYRAHDKEKKGDNISSQNHIKTALNGSSSSSVETGTDVNFTAYAAVPIKNSNGILLGVVSAGYSLDKPEYLEDLKKITNTDLTLFLNDTRVNTTITKDGQRQTGTKLDPVIAEKVIKNGEGYSGEANILGMPYRSVYKPFKDGTGKIIGVLFSGQSLKVVESTVNDIIYLIIPIVLVATVAFFIILKTYIYFRISKPLMKTVEASQKIIEGDLDFRIKSKSNDEIGKLLQAFSALADNLNEVMADLNEISKQVAMGSKQISDTSMLLSQGATEQASAIEELTASLQEISEKTKESAENARSANEIATKAKNRAVNGNNYMTEMLASIEAISQSSESISKVIKVIEDMAFQTNILALNAAVEAASAGEHGKGFAVVAEEVRNLANRSAKAAKETAQLIEGSIKNVENGNKIVKKTAAELDIIVNEVTKVADLMNEIAISSNEQAVGIEQINQGVQQVSEVVQSNTATAEESAAASEELAGQADILKERIARYKLRSEFIEDFEEAENDEIEDDDEEDEEIEKVPVKKGKK